VVGCARRLPRGQRGQVYLHLPDLCKSAGGPTRAAVRDALIEEVEEPKSAVGDYGAAVEALARLADARAFEVLVRQQGKRPITARNVHAARALKQADLARAPEAWLAWLRSHQPARVPADDERHLVQEVVGLLRATRLSEAQKKTLREVHAGAGEAWFAQVLQPLVK
jgi:hypothetical protein